MGEARHTVSRADFEGGSIRAGSPEGSVLPRVEGGVVFSRVDPGGEG